MLRSALNKIQTFGKTLARSSGLSIITHAFGFLRHPTGRGLHEPLKVAIRQSRWVSSTRSLIHMIPVGAALYEIILNWNEYYVGVNVYNQAVYQLIAKIHELMIQASLGAVLFSFVRHEMALGEGLPFGALFSALQLNQISYLWSLEFCGSIRSHHLTLWRKVRLSIIVSLCLLLGSLCGPSSAILLIPRLDFWPAGGTHIWLNASHEQLWPSRVDASMVHRSCFEALEYSPSNECPWSEWGALLEFLALSKGGVPARYRDAYGATYGPGYTELTGKSAARELYIYQDNTYIQQHVYPGLSTTQHASVADALASASSLWTLALTNVTARRGHGNPLSDQSNSMHTIKSDYLQPYASSFCAPDTLEGIHDERPLLFPTLLGANDASQSDTNMTFYGFKGLESVPAITKPEISRPEIFETPGSTSEYRLRWIDFSEDQFKGSSIGAIMFLPKADGNQSQPILACNLAAGWGESLVKVQASYDDSSDFVSSTVESAGLQFVVDSSRLDNAPAGQVITSNFFEYPYFPQVPINITQGWADHLSPRIIKSNSTIINRLMQEQVFPGDPKSYAHFVLSGLVVNGLARIGFTSSLQGDLRTVTKSSTDVELDGNYWLSGKGDVFTVNSSQANNWVKLYMESTLQGYSYNVINTAPRVAIAILTLYCVVALCHMFYAGISGISSTAWDSIAEVTALAMNSTPTATLRNTCAGISEIHIFKLPVRILSTKDKEGEGEHLELVFGTVPEERTKNDVIKPNRAYGTMPKVKKA